MENITTKKTRSVNNRPNCLKITKGTQKVNMTTVTLKDGSKVINEVDLTVKEDANKANILELYKRSIISILSGSM